MTITTHLPMRNSFLNNMQETTDAPSPAPEAPATEAPAPEAPAPEAPAPEAPAPEAPQTGQANTDWHSALIACPLRVVMLSYNHIMFAIKAGTFKDLEVEELQSVVNNASILKRMIPAELRSKVE